MKIPLATAMKSRDLTIKIGKKRIFVGVKGQPAIIDGLFYDDIEHEDGNWELIDAGKMIVINLQKPSRCWWTKLVTTDPEISRSKIEYPPMDVDEMNSYFGGSPYI